VETYVKKADDLDGVNQNLIPGLLDAILGDYNRNVPAARDAEVLNVMATIISRLASLLSAQIAPILDAIFEPTLGMINQDFAEYPEHRVGFFKMLRAINLTCFPGEYFARDHRYLADSQLCSNCRQPNSSWSLTPSFGPSSTPCETLPILV
jgi:hypothetical protein